MENGAQLLQCVCVSVVCVCSLSVRGCVRVCVRARECVRGVHVSGAVVLRVHARVALCMTTDGTSFCGHKHTHTHLHVLYKFHTSLRLYTHKKAVSSCSYRT